MNFEVSSCTKFQIFLGFRPGPRWRSLQRSPTPLAGREGLAAPFPRTPSPFSALRASSFIPLLPVREKISPRQNKFGLTPLVKMIRLITRRDKMLRVNWCWVLSKWRRRASSSSNTSLIVVLSTFYDLDELEIVQHPGLDRSFFPDLLDLSPRRSTAE